MLLFTVHQDQQPVLIARLSGNDWVPLVHSPGNNWVPRAHLPETI